MLAASDDPRAQEADADGLRVADLHPPRAALRRAAAARDRPPGDRRLHPPDDAERRVGEDEFNALGVLHSIFEAARREGWVAGNPCTLVDKPRARDTDPDIHFLEPEEVEALLRGVPHDDRGSVERRMYLTAAMTGMRPGELLALR